MAVIRKTAMTVHIAKLEKHYQELRQILDGDELNPNIYDQYSLTFDDYKRDFTEINLGELDYAITAYKTSLEKLAKLKAEQAPRRASNK